MTKGTADDDVLRIREIGDSIGIILPKDLLARLNLREGDRLQVIEQTENSVTISTLGAQHSRAIQIGRQLMDEYKDTFSKLAK